MAPTCKNHAYDNGDQIFLIRNNAGTVEDTQQQFLTNTINQVFFVVFRAPWIPETAVMVRFSVALILPRLLESHRPLFGVAEAEAHQGLSAPAESGGVITSHSQEVLSSAGYSITQLEKAMCDVRGSRKVDSQTGDENFEALRELQTRIHHEKQTRQPAG